MSKGTKIDISFPPDGESQTLYKRVIKSRPKDKKMAEHGRDLWQKALDCVCDNGKKRK